MGDDVIRATQVKKLVKAGTDVWRERFVIIKANGELEIYLGDPELHPRIGHGFVKSFEKGNGTDKFNIVMVDDVQFSFQTKIEIEVQYWSKAVKSALSTAVVPKGNAANTEIEEEEVEEPEAPVPRVKSRTPPKPKIDVATMEQRLLRLVMAESKVAAKSKQDVLKLIGSVGKDDVHDDLSKMPDLSPETIVTQVTKRYKDGLIYTAVGPLLVSVNPNQPLDIYGPSVAQVYMEQSNLPPHLFGIADLSYRAMMRDRKGQSVLISGESGAGKTEATKILLNYLAAVSEAETKRLTSGDSSLRRGVSVANKVLSANPLLEAFGNAKTVRNDNSSRFGKFFLLDFDSNGVVTGAKLAIYLLEKSRLTIQGPQERNFHIFYQLLKGADSVLRKELMLEEAASYKIAPERSCTRHDAEDLEDIKDVASSLGFNAAELHAVFKIIAAILHLGNAEFSPSGPTSKVDVVDPACFERAARLLGVDEDVLMNAVRQRTMQTSSMAMSVYYVPLDAKEATSALHALCKSLYDRLFHYVVKKINLSLHHVDDAFSFIGVLDIFGFEIFEKNSFEQLCINYANEKLHQLFIKQIFVTEQSEYKREGIAWDHIEFINNQKCIDLLEIGMGVFPMLDEECAMPKGGDDGFISKLKLNQAQHPYFGMDRCNPDVFIVKHYVGPVTYHIEGMVQKNRDRVHDDLLTALIKSDNLVLPNLLMEKDADFQRTKQRMGSVVASSTTEDSDSLGGLPSFGSPSSRIRSRTFDVQQSDGRRKRPVSCRVGGRHGGSGSALNKPTVARQFTSSLSELMDTLYQTDHHHVKCFKSNNEKKPNNLDEEVLREQLHCSGLFETVRIRKQGYAERMPLDEFFQRYKIIHVAYEGKDAREFAVSFKESMKFSDVEMGVGNTRVYLQTEALIERLEFLRGARISEAAVKIQSTFRMYMARVVLAALKVDKTQQDEACQKIAAAEAPKLSRRDVTRVNTGLDLLKKRDLRKGVQRSDTHPHAPSPQKHADQPKGVATATATTPAPTAVASAISSKPEENLSADSKPRGRFRRPTVTKTILETTGSKPASSSVLAKASAFSAAVTTTKATTTKTTPASGDIGAPKRKSVTTEQVEEVLATRQNMSEALDNFVKASDFMDTMKAWERILQLCGIKQDWRPTDPWAFYNKLKEKTSIAIPHKRTFFNFIDARKKLPEYKDRYCSQQRVIVVGCGPGGMRAAIEACLVGAASVSVVEHRPYFARNNVLHLWPCAIQDLLNLGVKCFYKQFCSGDVSHIAIRRMQSTLMKLSLVLGARIYYPVRFKGFGEQDENGLWVAKLETITTGHPDFIDPSLFKDPPTLRYNVLLGADGEHSTIAKAAEIERSVFQAGKAIGITANFVNRKTSHELTLDEFGISAIYFKKWFGGMTTQYGIALENIVYYRDETHYFVMTAKKQCLLDKGVLLQDFGDYASLLAGSNVDRSKLETFCCEVAEYCKIPAGFKLINNHRGVPDVAAFDFTKKLCAQNGGKVIRGKNNSKLLVCLVGDCLLEPFWPLGTGANRAIMSALDAAWLMRNLGGGLDEEEALKLRDQQLRWMKETSPNNTHADKKFGLDPKTRYKACKVNGPTGLKLPPSVESSDILKDPPPPTQRRPSMGVVRIRKSGRNSIVEARGSQL